MGFIRGSLLVITSFLLFLSILSSNIFLIATMTLDYDNVKPELINIANDLIQQQLGEGVQEIKSNLEEYNEELEKFCEEGEEFNLQEFGYNISFSCDDLEEKTVESFVETNIGNFVDELYYKDYGCEFWDCIKGGDPLFLISENSHDYWKSKLYQSFWIIGILLILVFILVVEKSNTFILSGSLFIGASLPFLGLNKLLEFLLEKEILQFLTIILSKANLVFWISFLIGFVLLVAGISFRIFEVGLKFVSFLQKFKKADSEEKLVKKKINESKPEKIEKKSFEKENLILRLKNKFKK
jgi:hypothetical protein